VKRQLQIQLRINALERTQLPSALHVLGYWLRRHVQRRGVGSFARALQIIRGRCYRRHDLKFERVSDVGIQFDFRLHGKGGRLPTRIV
jgi:hypothetical protein